MERTQEGNRHEEDDTDVPRPVKRWALKRWRAETAGGGRRGADRHATPGRDAILIDTDAFGAESCDLLALAHAAGRACSNASSSTTKRTTARSGTTRCRR